VDWIRFSIISSEEADDRKGFDVVRIDQFRTTLKLLRQIKADGFRRIGICLREHEPLHADDETRCGAASAFLRYDAEAGSIPVLSVPFQSQNFEGKLISWIKKYRPDVVLGFSIQDRICLEKYGMSVPGDVCWVALHVEEYNRGKVAGLQFNQEIIPEYAIRLLFEKKSVTAFADFWFIRERPSSGRSCWRVRPVLCCRGMMLFRTCCRIVGARFYRSRSPGMFLRA
jgi:hypothetical protein